MNWVKLYGGIANCYEFFDPDYNLLDYVSEDDDFTIALLERPTFLRAELSFLLCFLQGLGEYVDTTDLRQSKAVFKLDI